MKVLFLDMDGVCNSGQWAMKGNDMWHGVDPEAAKLVQRIIEATGCKVVLSSTWRIYPEAREAVRQKVCDFIDCTVDMQEGRQWGFAPRGNEIREWLERHHGQVERYAVLDDESDFYPDQCLFKTTFMTGLTPEIAEAVIKHLNAAPGYAQ